MGAFAWKTACVPDTLQIRVTAVGYKSFNGTYSPKNQGNKLWIRIQQEATALNEVIVTAKKVYMVVKGDTLVYKAESFKILEGDFIGNLLQKLPEVSLDHGLLTVNGGCLYRLLCDVDLFSKIEVSRR